MKIYYCPFYNGNYFLDMKDNHVAMDVQVQETQGLLIQLALHAGIHQEIPSYPERLTAYHKAILEHKKDYKSKPEKSIFYNSIVIDSMSVAKTLLQWRDYLALCGWNGQTQLDGCTRLNDLAAIDTHYQDNGMAVLLAKLQERVRLMESGDISTPKSFQSLVIEIPSKLELLPDYIQPLMKSLQKIGVQIEENEIKTASIPKQISEIHFSQQWKAEAWLSQLPTTEFDVWINGSNKRLDNWLHMSGKPVCGSEMTDTNPQITQLFLLAIQLFQRPLNVNTLLQYLFLPECPLDKKLRTKLARKLVSEGGFCNKTVWECINAYIEREFKEEGDKTPQEKTREEREENYETYLPFDLRQEESALPLAEESDSVDVKTLLDFLSTIRNYASERMEAISHLQPYDARIAQLRCVTEMIDVLQKQIGTLTDGEMSFTMLSQWAQSLYEDGDYDLFQAQVGSRCIINHPTSMIGKAQKTIWCDFYGDVASTLSTDFLSINEQQRLHDNGIHIWNRQHETKLMNLLLTQPVYKTSHILTIITCDQQGATKLPIHPLYLQLPKKPVKIDGDALYKTIATKETEHIDNHRESDSKEICFDAKNHPVKWRTTESHSSLEKLLQDPFDYFMQYTLQFADANETDIKLQLTNGNVAHKVIEMLFTADRNGMSLEDYIISHYEQAFNSALVKKGALLLLPEHHLDKDRLKYLLKGCVIKLATLIRENGLTVIECEQEEKQDLEFEGGIIIHGYIDMVLRDKAGNDVVFDLKYVSKKDKYKKILEDNRAMQLAIYEAMLMKHENHSPSVRTAYFVMPSGILYSTNEFSGDNFQHVNPKIQAEVMLQIRNGYKERVCEINEGKIETGDNYPLTDLDYTNAKNVFPLNSEGKKVKAENLYSDYKCFTI